jgi:glycosyltransferase involved in cell wall biosynthesis
VIKKKNQLNIQSDIVVVSKYAILPSYGISSKIFQTANTLSNHFNTLLITSNSNHLASFPKSKAIYNKEQFEHLNSIWINTLDYKNSKSIKRILSWFDFEWKLSLLKVDPLSPPRIVLISSLSIFTIHWALRLKKKYGTKVVFEVRDIYPLTLTSELNVSRWNPVVLLMSYLEKRGYQESDLIVGTMPHLDKHVKHILGYQKTTFYSPIGLSSYHKSTGTSEIKINRQSLIQDINYYSSLIIMYSGSIGESNYLESFVRVIKGSNSNLNYYFVLVGSGDYLDKYKQELKECSNVHFTGRVAPQDVKCYLEQADVLYLSVKPSIIWEYGQSMNKVLDYMMSGKPIIASYDGIPNMLDEIEHNIIIPSNDDVALINALEQSLEYLKQPNEELKKKSRQLIEENYTYDVINKNYLQQIQRLLNED